MKVDPDIYCHRRLLLLTQIVSTVSLSTNGTRRLLHTIRPDPFFLFTSKPYCLGFIWVTASSETLSLTAPRVACLFDNVPEASLRKVHIRSLLHLVLVGT